MSLPYKRHPLLVLIHDTYRSAKDRAMTLVEVLIALLLLATVLLGFLGGFMQSRRTTEASVLHAAATSLIYGFMEQMKMLDYTTQMPDTTTTPPTVTVRVNQDTNLALNVVNTQAPGAPQGPNSTPDVSITTISGVPDNILTLPLSTISTYNAQPLIINIWVWIDEIPDSAKDVVQVKKVTVVYTYQFNDGSTVRTVRDREVFLRTLYSR